MKVGISCQFKDVSRRRAFVAKSVRALTENDSIIVKMRPLKTRKAPPLDDFGQLLFGDEGERAEGNEEEEVDQGKRRKGKRKGERKSNGAGGKIRQIAEDLSLSKAETLDRMLLVLFDALLLTQAEEWTARGLGNLPADETYELARWWYLGQNVAKNALFDGICAMCGALLYGAQNRTSAISNKCSSPPCNREGIPVRNADGTPNTEAQPPFLLRYSPQLFAKEAPEMFVWDEGTNRLSLAPGKTEPWVRPGHAKIAQDDPNTWLYCTECWERQN